MTTSGVSMAARAVPAKATLDPRVVEQVLLEGDLSKLATEQRLSYYNHVCETVGLNPYTQPLAYIKLNGKLVLYAKKDATDQLRKLHTISLEVRAREVIDGVYVVTAQASMPTGRVGEGMRCDESTGAVAIDGLKGEARANAMMKAETKAKRRVTLSICGLGMLDETEVETIPGAALVTEAASRIVLPSGTVQVLRVEPARKGHVEWAIVTFVDDQGVETQFTTEATTHGAPVAIFEQLAQDKTPLLLATKVAPRSKKTVIDLEQTRRWDQQKHELFPRPLDPKVAKALNDGEPF